MNEQALIHELRQGNESAFKAVVQQYRDRVYRTALNILQDEKEAEDSAQETFIQVFESIGKFRGDSSLSTWIYQIAARKALDKLRRKKTRQKLLSILPWWMPKENPSPQERFRDPAVLAENKEKSAILFKAVEKLPEKQKLAFMLIKIQGMNYEEVCDIMQQNVKAVESLVMRAKMNLQKQLETYYNQSK